jgi:hypothetical protein
MSTVEIVILIGSISGALLSIWALFERIQKKLLKGITNQIEEAIDKNNKELIEYFKEHVESVTILTIREIDSLKEIVDTNNDLLIEKLKNFSKLSSIRQHIILEVVKQYFREIHKTVRITGEIDDEKMSFLDSLFPYYKELGGNSDIEAKYREIRSVYEKRIAEVTDSASKRRRERKQQLEQFYNKNFDDLE